MRQQRRNTVKKKCETAWRHQKKKQKGNNSTLDMSQRCANCCLSIDSSTNKTSNTSQQQSSSYSGNFGGDDPPTSDNVTKMISIIYNLDFIPRLVQKYPNAMSSEDAQVIVDFPLCCFCTNLFQSLFSLYSQFNEIREIESLLSRQINSLHFLINYDGQTQQSCPHDKGADDSRGPPTSMTRNVVNLQDTTTTTSNSSSRAEFNSTDPEPCIWVEIDPLDDLTVEEIGYAPPSLRHLYHEASQRSSSSMRRQETANQPEIEQERSRSCHSNTTKLEFSSNDRGPWVKVGSRLEGLTAEDCSSLTLDPNLIHEPLQSTLEFSKVFTIPSMVHDDHDMTYEPSNSSDDDNSANDNDDEPSPQPDPPQSEDEDFKPGTCDMELEENSGETLRAKKSRRKPKIRSVREEPEPETKSDSIGDEDHQAKTKSKKQKKDKKKAPTSGEKNFSCTVIIDETGKICPFQTNVHYVLQVHMFTVHGDEKDNNKCGDCGKEFESIIALKNHVRHMHTDAGRKRYERGKEKAKERSRARIRERNAKGFSCPHCGIDFANKVSWTKHLRTVHDDYSGVKNIVACELCRKKFKNSTDLKRHMQTVHSSSDARPFPCQICERRYKTKSDLGNHMRKSHNEEGRLKCRAHSAASLQKKKLLRQEALRKAGFDVTANVCHHCGIDFITRRKCTIHRRAVHDDYSGTIYKVVMCEYCGKKLEGNGQLKVHMQHVHSDERPFVCDLCGVSFKSEANLGTHKKLCHTVEGKEKGKLYQRENLRRKKLIREQMAKKEGQEMEAETETSDIKQAKSESEIVQTRETAVVTRPATSGSSLPLPAPSTSICATRYVRQQLMETLCKV